MDIDLDDIDPTDSSHLRAKWTPEQFVYDQLLRTGPTAALEQFRTAYSLRSPGPVNKDSEPHRLSEVLWDYLTICDETDDIWCACADNAFILLLLQIMAEPESLRHFWVSPNAS